MPAQQQSASVTDRGLLKTQIEDLKQANQRFARHMANAEKCLADAITNNDDPAKATANIEEGTKALDAAKRSIGLPGAPLDEWKECRVTIDRFDKLLSEVRKTGYTFVAAVIGLASLFLGRGGPITLADEAKFAILSAIMILSLALFCYDWMLGRWLKAAVDRAASIEAGQLKFELTRSISNAVGVTTSGLIALIIYGAFWGTALILLISATSGAAFMLPVGITAVVAVLLFISTF